MQATESVDYGVRVHSSALLPEWIVKEVSHLTPEQNKGKHHIYVDALDEHGNRAQGVMLNWGWDGGGEQPAIAMDKPIGEPMCNIPVYKGQTIAVWMGEHSDVVIGLHTMHPDEFGPNGEKWNSAGHHSFYICFQKVARLASVGDPCPMCAPHHAGIISKRKNRSGNHIVMVCPLCGDHGVLDELAVEMLPNMDLNPSWRL